MLNQNHFEDKIAFFHIFFSLCLHDIFCSVFAGLLRSFFDTLYDEDVISEDAFNQWETSTDPAEQLGKGVAKNSVVQFFTWLREAEEEESQDDN